MPNANAMIYLPTEIFDFPMMPTSTGPTKFLDGSVDLAMIGGFKRLAQGSRASG